MNPIYHLYSRGSNVLFRSAQDYIRANNKLAASSHISGVPVIAMSIMSSHLHIVAEAESYAQITELTAALTQSYAFGYNAAYGHSISRKLQLDSRLLADRQEVLTAVLYVMKNPIHHGACPNVFEYRFGSGAYLFGRELAACMTGGKAESLFRRYGNLTATEKRAICRTAEMPEEWLISDDGMVMPFSYIDMQRARGIWKNNLKTFLYDMNKGIAEQGFAVEREDSMDLSWNRLNDIEVCRMIDDYAASHGRRSFHFLTECDKAEVVGRLMQQRVPPRQVARCMWLTEDEVRRYARR